MVLITFNRQGLWPGCVILLIVLVNEAKGKNVLDDIYDSLKTLKSETERIFDKIQTIEANVDTMSSNVNSISASVDKMSSMFNSSSNFNSVSTIVHNMSSIVNSIDKNVDTMNSNVKSIGTDVDMISNVVNSIDINVDTVSKNVNTINESVVMMSSNVNSIDTNVDTMISNVNSIGTNVDTISNVVNSIDINVDTVSKNVNTINENAVIMSNKVNTIGDNIDIISTIVNNTNAIVGRCPAGDGFFFAPGTEAQQCMKAFVDTSRDWYAAAGKCTEEGLVLARPHNALQLQLYFSELYSSKSFWLGAKADGQQYIWQRSGPGDDELSNESQLWMPGFPGHDVTNEHCLVLNSDPSTIIASPDTPYFTSLCKTSRYTLCEKGI